ncbi:hypothetical protein Corgl_0143 [Coriobacterium glomerans PW2]|uniref:Uncharacterized protein n=2 Tax=Coriobacterium TaxID=33870 RepID=F2NA15_CORGP|nr:hypothetical protein Corgl_0143 [Coriobacterium glomerans PW2]
MSLNRKILKLLSFAQIIVSIVAIVFAVISFSRGGESAEAASSVFGMQLAASVWAMVRDASLILLAIVTIAASAAGIRGANRPSSLGSHRPLSLIGLILGLVCCAIAFGLETIPALIIAVLLALYHIASLIVGGRVRRELDR